MPDYLYHGEWPAARLRFSYAHTTQLANHAVLLHRCDPVAAHLFTRALTGGVLLSPLLAEDERYSFYWQYDGAVRSITVEASPGGAVRGIIAQPGVMGQVQEEGQVYGTTGTVSGLRTRAGRVLNSSVTAAGMLDVVDDLALWLCLGEQRESSLVVLVAFNADEDLPVRLCHGFLLQALPDCDLPAFDTIRQRLQSPQFRHHLGQPPRTDNHLELLLRALVADDAPAAPACTLYASAAPAYACRCSRAKSRAAITTMPVDDLRAVIERGQPLSIRCHYCCQDYTFTIAELTTFLPPA